MGHMKKYSCPSCLATEFVVGFGRRKKVLRYFCKSCQKHFSINPCFIDKKAILQDHLEGLSFRDLARKHAISPMTAWSKFFFYFRLISHRPDLIVCDDNTNIKLAARKNFPQVKIQTCFNHFKENIRRDLRVRSEDTYKFFMERIED